MRCFVVACCSVVALSLSACSQKVLVKTEAADARVTLGDVENEEVPPDGVRVKVPPGLSAVPFVVEDARGRREGVIERSEVQWAWIAAGVAGAACCAPALVLGGACLANPALATASVGCLIAQSPAPCCAVLAAPSWATVPVAGGGALLGLTPLSLGLLSEQVPDKIVLDEVAPVTPPSSGEDEAVPF